MTDRSHQVPVDILRIYAYPHDPVRASSAHGHEAGTYTVPASAVFHIHDPVRLIDSLGQLTEAA